MATKTYEKINDWVRCDDRMPIPAESPSGYFWCWNENNLKDSPDLVEPYDYEDYHETPCNDFDFGYGMILGYTHWIPAYPPEPPINKKS